MNIKSLVTPLLITTTLLLSACQGGDGDGTNTNPGGAVNSSSMTLSEFQSTYIDETIYAIGTVSEDFGSLEGRLAYAIIDDGRFTKINTIVNNRTNSDAIDISAMDDVLTIDESNYENYPGLAWKDYARVTENLTGFAEFESVTYESVEALLSEDCDSGDLTNDNRSSEYCQFLAIKPENSDVRVIYAVAHINHYIGETGLKETLDSITSSNLTTCQFPGTGDVEDTSQLTNVCFAILAEAQDPTTELGKLIDRIAETTPTEQVPLFSKNISNGNNRTIAVERDITINVTNGYAGGGSAYPDDVDIDINVSEINYTSNNNGYIADGEIHITYDHPFTVATDSFQVVIEPHL